jgi:glutathione peroxidase
MKMGLFTLLTLGTLLLAGAAFAAYHKFFHASRSYTSTPSAMAASFYDLEATTLDGKPFPFSSLRGKRVLIVNTASKCGFTPQYADLEKLHQLHGGKDFVILGFPSNDFGKQEPGTQDEIAEFCEKNYGVTFQMFDKVIVKGKDTHPVYQWLCQKALNGVADHEVGWNFHKFTVDGSGVLVGSYRSGVKPLSEELVRFAAGQ